MSVGSHALYAAIFERLSVNQLYPYEFHNLATSIGRDWCDVSMYEGAVGPMPGGSIVAESLRYGSYSISMTVQGTVMLGAHYDDKTYSAWSAPGNFSLLPPQGDAGWTSNAAGQVYHLFLSPRLFEVAAAEFNSGDPARAAVPFLFNLRDPLAEQICWALRHELYAPGPVSRLYVETLAQSLVLHLLHTLSAGRMRSGAQRARPVSAGISRTIDYIEAHIASSIGLVELAAIAHVSPSTLARQFKHVTGLAPHQYLLRRRIERARQLLQAGQLTVAEVAQAVGFADQSHLSRHLQRAFGLTARELLPRG